LVLIDEGKMRLKDSEITAIKESITKFDADAQVYLFGSRVDDNKRGGDIDILIISSTIGSVEKRKIRTMICDRIGEQKIDIVITPDITKPFVKIAFLEGIKL
jgi:predicted nucleotidyltransferase